MKRDVLFRKELAFEFDAAHHLRAEFSLEIVSELPVVKSVVKFDDIRRNLGRNRRKIFVFVIVKFIARIYGMTYHHYRIGVLHIGRNRLEFTINFLRVFVRSRVFHFFRKRREFRFDLIEVGSYIL